MSKQLSMFDIPKHVYGTGKNKTANHESSFAFITQVAQFLNIGETEPTVSCERFLIRICVYPL